MYFKWKQFCLESRAESFLICFNVSSFSLLVVIQKQLKQTFVQLHKLVTRCFMAKISRFLKENFFRIFCNSSSAFLLLRKTCESAGAYRITFICAHSSEIPVVWWCKHSRCSRWDEKRSMWRIRLASEIRRKYKLNLKMMLLVWKIPLAFCSPPCQIVGFQFFTCQMHFLLFCTTVVCRFLPPTSARPRRSFVFCYDVINRNDLHVMHAQIEFPKAFREWSASNENRKLLNIAISRNSKLNMK